MTMLELAAPWEVWLAPEPLSVPDGLSLAVLEEESLLPEPDSEPEPEVPVVPAPATEVTPLGRLPRTTVVEEPTETVKYVTPG